MVKTQYLRKILQKLFLDLFTNTKFIFVNLMKQKHDFGVTLDVYE